MKIVGRRMGEEWSENRYIRLLKGIDDEIGQCGITMIPSYPII